MIDSTAAGAAEYSQRLFALRKIRVPKQSIDRLRWLALCLLAGLGLLFLPRIYLLLIPGILVIWAFCVFAIGSITKGQLDWVILTWIVVFPLGYYFLSFPTGKPLFTLDRALIAALVLSAVCQTRSSRITVLADLRAAAWWWLAFIVVAALSVWWLPYRDMVGCFHILLEDFAMPALLGWFILYRFDVKRNLVWVHACSCLMAFYIALIGLAELTTGQNLLPITDTAQFVETSDLKIFRVDGPFESSTPYALIGMIAFFLIPYLRRHLPTKLPLWQRLLHYLGIAGSLSTGLMPMHRGLELALLAVCVVDCFSQSPLVRRQYWYALAAAMLGAILIAKFTLPDLYHSRVTDADNVYMRLAQHAQTIQVIKDHPILGVGINCFYQTVSMNPRYLTNFHGFDSMNFAHNTLLSITAETGLVGLLCYVIAQFYFVKTIWKTRTVAPLGWQVFLYIFMIYTIFGLDVTSGYFSDLNLWYMMVLAIISQLQAESMLEFEHWIYNYRSASEQSPLVASLATFARAHEG